MGFFIIFANGGCGNVGYCDIVVSENIGRQLGRDKKGIHESVTDR